MNELAGGTCERDKVPVGPSGLRYLSSTGSYEGSLSSSRDIRYAKPNDSEADRRVASRRHQFRRRRNQVSDRCFDSILATLQLEVHGLELSILDDVCTTSEAIETVNNVLRD